MYTSADSCVWTRWTEKAAEILLHGWCMVSPIGKPHCLQRRLAGSIESFIWKKKNYLKFQHVACRLPMCLRCFKEWLLSLKLWGSVNHTGFRLWTWHLVRTYLPSKLWCHFWPHPHPFPKWREKLLSERLQNPDQFPLVLGPLLSLQPRATTVV